MQKLFSRCSSPSGHTLLLCTSPPPPSGSLFLSPSYPFPIPKPKPIFHSLSSGTSTSIISNSSPLGFCVKHTRFQESMPSPAAFNLRPCIGFLPNSNPSPSSSKPPSCRVAPTIGNCGICRCSIENATTPQRKWAVFKETKSGSRMAWFHTAAGDGAVLGSQGLEENKEEDEERETGVSVSKEEEEEMQPSVKLHRRARNAVSGLQGNPDLLTIPGVGPRNLRKLVQKGIGGVAELKKLYRDKFFGKSNQKMVDYLQSSVGIIHRNHAESITTYIKKSVDEDPGEDSSNSILNSQKKRITLCVEGNISVGKTTFLKRIANETLELRDLVEIVPEPIDKWQNVGPDHFNILDAFYADPERYAYTFQNYVFVTRVMQERDSSAGIQPLRLMERSVFSDRMVFVRAVHEAKWMNEMEISIYDSWFDPVVSCLPGLVPDGFIYLRASPDTCHKRMMVRKRDEEGGVSLDYLRGLHEKHESWLFPSQAGKHDVLSISKLASQADTSLHPVIRDRVFFLEGPQMHSCLQKVPALILDCERDIDFNRDVDAKRHYAHQVAEFFEFVKREKEVQSPVASEQAGKGSQSQVLLPQNGGGLCFPDGMPFSESALRSMDFSRTLSFLSG